MDRSDHARWRLQDRGGRHLWHYLHEDDKFQQQPLNFQEKYFLGIRDDDTNLHATAKPETARQAAANAFKFFSKLQMPSGHWACEFTGPNVDIYAIVITLYVIGHPLIGPEKLELIRYIYSIQNADGGWGLHIAGETTTFGTIAHYVALRLLGVPAHRLQLALGCLNSLGGASNCPQLARFWLAVLGVFPWDVVLPVPPDVWLLPDWLPISPWRWWVYARAIHLPMGYIYSKQWSYSLREKDSLIKELRDELLGRRAPDEISKWREFGDAIDARDNFHPISWVLWIIYFLLNWLYMPFLRTATIARRAERTAYKLIKHDDENTGFATLASIVAPFTLLACYIEEGPQSESVKEHVRRLRDFFWMTEDGLVVNVTSGVQTWDTAFAVQAAVAAGLVEHMDPETRNTLSKALEYLDDNQMEHSIGYTTSTVFSEHPTKKTCVETAYRHPRRGAWGFSEKAQGYPVSNCTAEALKAVLMLQTAVDPIDPSTTLFPTRISERRLQWTVDVILTYQEADGGCSCYEPRRGSTWLECLNPAQIFDNIMVPYPYPECTGSCLTALQLFREIYPQYRSHEIACFIDKAIAYICNTQKSYGSWKGSWGICFTYASYFTLEALASQGMLWANNDNVRQACAFLIRKQNLDGGWGESFETCVTGLWHDHPDGSQDVQTSWALIALLQAQYPIQEPLKRAVGLLMRRQELSGEFRQEDVEGAHNRSSVLKYPNYKFIFTTRALGMYGERYGF